MSLIQETQLLVNNTVNDGNNYNARSIVRRIRAFFNLNEQNNGFEALDINQMSNENYCVKISCYIKEKEKSGFGYGSHATVRNIINECLNNNNTHFENLLSFLIYDWYEQNENSPKSYFLVIKFSESFEEVNEEITSYKMQRKLFEKLFDVFNNREQMGKYHYYCLKIIYYFFHEAKDVEFDNDDIHFLINQSLNLNNREYKYQILKNILVFLKNTNDEKYESIKIRIINSIEDNINQEYPSICKISYESIVNHRNRLFFKLLFLLKENFTTSFKVEYKSFINSVKNYFGEYWMHAIKLDAKLLYFITIKNHLVDIKEFILISTGCLDLKSDIVNIFKDVGEFKAVFKQPFEKNENAKLEILESFIKNDEQSNERKKSPEFEEFTKIFRNTKEIRKLLFGRRTLDNLSIFEEILSKCDQDIEDFDKIIDHIWNEYKLWEIPEIFILKNPQHKGLLDYVMDTKNDPHIISFFMPKVPDEYEEIFKPQYYMMLKNALFYDYLKNQIEFIDSSNSNPEYECYIEFHLNLIDKNEGKDSENIMNVLYLLEEIQQFYPEKIGANEFIDGIIKKILNEKPVEYDGQRELSLPRKYLWMGMLMIYWNYFIDSDSEKFYLRNLSNPNQEILSFRGSLFPFLHLLSLIVEKKEVEFMEKFPSEIEKMEKKFSTMFKIHNMNEIQISDDNEPNHYYESYSTHFCYMLLYAAIKKNEKNIINIIFEYNNFLTTFPHFPRNMKVNETHYYATLMFLKNKFELLKGFIPKNWITQEFFEKFLNSRITNEEKFYKIDCEFMLRYFNQGGKLDEINDDALMNEDYETMDYILKENNLKSLISHPVMEVFITTKIQKYDRIFWWNFYGFFLTYIVPTVVLMYFLRNPSSSDDSVKSNINENSSNPQWNNSTNIDEFSNHFVNRELNIFWIVFISLFRLLILAPREIFQLFLVSEYLKKKSNYCEIGLIFFPFILAILATVYHWIPHFIMIFIEVLNILLMIISTAILLPSLKFSIYMKCFLTVVTIYVKILLFFLPLFAGCIAIIYILFDQSIGGEIGEFHDLRNTTMKYIIMYSGELSISPDKLSGIIQGVAMTLVIIFIINKANLILSIVVNDVIKILEQSKEHILKLNATKYVEFAHTIRKFYATKIDIENKAEIKKLAWFGFLLIKFFIRKYNHVHFIRILYVEKKSGYVYVDGRNPVFGRNIFWNENLKLDDETMFKIQKIVKNE